MKLFVLLLVSILGLEARDSKKDDDPAPGRSGPPFSDTYVTESHESYRPVEPPVTLMANHHHQQEDKMPPITNNQKAFGDIMSRMSSESVEYFDNGSENLDDNQDSIVERARNGKLLLNDRSGNESPRQPLDIKVNLLSDSILSQSHRQTAQAQLDNDNSNAVSSSLEDNGSASSETLTKSCETNEEGSIVSSYLKLGDKVIVSDINNLNENRISPDKEGGGVVVRQRSGIDVTHDVFETKTKQGGLLMGVVYKVEVLKSNLLDAIDFIVQTTVNNKESIGEFVLPADQRGEVRKSQSLKESDIEGSNKFAESIERRNACEKNVVYHKFNVSEKEESEKVSWNWTIKNIHDKFTKKGENNSVTFRLLYRQRNRREIYETNFTLILFQECLLTLKAYTGWFDSSLIPSHAKNCTFRFSTSTEGQIHESSPGLLVKLIRLNVPCSSGGFVQFNRTITMCGKLEELPENQRTLYFHSFAKTTLSVYNYPKFHFVYKLVDHCYNVTFLERNSSFVIRPTHLALKCHFKIHLPFGNQIKLKLRLLDDAEKSVANERNFLHKTINLTKSFDDQVNNKHNADYKDLNVDDFSLSTDDTTPFEPPSCGGVLIEIANRRNERWSQCTTLKRFDYELTSSDNVLLIRITKQKNRTKSDDESFKRLISLEYSAVPITSIVSQCAFGWILVGQFCMSSFSELLSWQSSESFCNELGGNLASIRNENEQQMIDEMVSNSPFYTEHTSFWIGASDKHFEGDFRWTDGLPFSYSRWFPGWKHFENFNRQPNDDGLSNQDCVEIRRHFHQPGSSTSSLTDSFMWNDLDCSEKNFFICERSLIDEPASSYEMEDCNKTIYLSRDRMKRTFTSPGFPRFYPDNLNCVTFIVAPNGYRILIEFEELVLEHEPLCTYDYLEMFEPTVKKSSNTSRHNRSPKNSEITGFPSVHQQQQLQQLEFQKLLKDSLHQSSQLQTIFQPSNATYNVFRPPPSTTDRMPRKICGDWSSKLKLLRYRTSSNVIGFRFSSDYSHHFSGFKAKVSLEKAASDCIDERLKLFNDSCYLVVSFPEVEWVVAQKICHSMGAQLSSVSTLEEHRFIIATIKSSIDYNQRTFYWLGAEYSSNGASQWEWTDGSRMSFTGWPLVQEPVPKAQPGLLCLGLQWKMSSAPMTASNLFWAFQKCSNMGGYVCKKNRKNNVLIQNQTITGIEGRLTSPDYPNQYASNIDYWIKIIAPEKSRIVVQFQKIDIEQQQECLYDYASIQDSDFHNDMHSKRNDVLGIDGKKTHRVDKRGAIVMKSSLVLDDTSPSFQPYTRWCGAHEGDMSQFDFVSKTNEILFHFTTDHSISGEGFSAIWRAIDISACPGQTFTSREGVLTSPNFPHFLLHNLNCSYTIQAPLGRKIWIEFNSFDIQSGAEVFIDLGDGVLREPLRDANVIGDGVYSSRSEKVKILLKTGLNPKGKGFKVTFRTMQQIVEHRFVKLSNTTFGHIYHLNYPQAMPSFVDFTQHLTAPLGNVISIELQGVEFAENGCDGNGSLEIFDNYADRNGTVWQLCQVKTKKESSAPIFIASYLNTVQVRQRTNESHLGLLNGTIRVQSDMNYKLKLISSSDDWVESCQPNPCLYDGKCVASGEKKVCQCRGHFTGRFCGLTMCELDPCVFGQCELTASGFKCNCQPGYLGLTCEQRQKPCNDNPCEGRGECVEKNGGYMCKCFAWFEGPKCDKRMRIPYRPLSERMLQEPFWLGLITVFVVLAVIGLVWCAKRHFPEKIEKLLQEEADRNRPAHLRHHHHISLREQLQVAGAANNPLMQQGGPPQAVVTTPGTGKSIFGRLGIRKPSLLSLSSPQPPQGSTARTFSLDDLLRPLPRPMSSHFPTETPPSKEHNSHVGSPSPRKKRNNSTPTRKNAAEKKLILQQLVSPNVKAKMTLGELIQLSENTNNNCKSALNNSDGNLRETTFNEGPGSSTAPQKTLTRQISSDPKLEKKVTFARLLNKMSAEIHHGSEIDGNNHSSALSLPTEVQLRANSVPHSPCTNDIRSPHSTSSNQGSDSLSSSELALHDFSFKNNGRKHRPKVSSADSILAMFRNFASSSAGVNLPTSLVFSPSSSTPTASSPQDDVAGDDESSTSSGLPTPVSFSSGAPDSPVFYRPSTIEVPVLDALSAHKATPSQNLLHPPTIMLEIPGNINKCLSPIKELPTPMPSPALTPIMPRPHRLQKASHIRDEAISVTLSDEDDKNQSRNRSHILIDLTSDPSRVDSDNDSTTLYTTSSENSNYSLRRTRPMLIPSISIEIESSTPDRPLVRRERPKDLIIPDLIVQTPSPTRERLSVATFGSPPPQRASIGETSELFPNKQQQRRLMKCFEKPGSLDFPFVPPMITITANLSEAESDAEFLSPATSKSSLMPSKLMPNTTGMTYLSPFSMCAQRDRAPSEGNLSSSGYSSMASPGPSRCGSNSKLCSNEIEPIISITVPSSTNIRRHQSILKKADEGADKVAKGNEEFRKRSDSETLSDETLLESNDEGIGTDHLDEKIEDGDIRSAKDLEVFIGKELLENGKILLNTEDVITMTQMSQLQLPSIVIQSESGFDKLSPVSSRSESPLSERNTGMGRFSPQFYGRKDTQLPFTDSDGLYDFPSSDGKGGTSGLQQQQHKKSTGRRRERRSSKTNLIQSPSKSSVHLDIPAKATTSNQHSSTASKAHSSTNFARRSPKRRTHRYTPSSSSSTESLTANSNTKELTMPSKKLRDCLIENIEMKNYEHVSDEADKYGSGSKCLLLGKSPPPKKMSRMKAIGNQIRFLRRLERALKERDKGQHAREAEQEESEPDSPGATSPLLAGGAKPKTSFGRFSRQKKVTNVYSFEPDQSHDYLSD